MKPITLIAYFDGEQIRLDEPFKLEPGTKLIVTVLPKHQPDSELADWLGLSKRGLENAYGEVDPDYSLDSIKEPNPKYERS